MRFAMTLLTKRMGTYLAGVLDGYIPKHLPVRVAERARTAPSLEQSIAEYLHKILQGDGSGPEDVFMRPFIEVCPYNAHAWVIGSPGWITGPMTNYGLQLWRLLAGDEERRDDYRVAFFGVHGPQLILERSLDAIAHATVLDAKNRNDEAKFTETATTILELLGKTYTRTGRAPYSKVEVQGVPLAFAGF